MHRDNNQESGKRMNGVIKGNLEVLDQAITFISGMPNDAYVFTCETLFTSTIGQHLRHVLDLYKAVMKASGSNPLGTIDYDQRGRGLPLEYDRAAGLAELKVVRDWSATLTNAQLVRSCRISTEVCLSTTQPEQMDSNIGREICFVSSHLTHHLALMGVLAKLAGCQVNNNLGIAPATQTFLRAQS